MCRHRYIFRQNDAEWLTYCFTTIEMSDRNLFFFTPKHSSEILEMHDFVINWALIDSHESINMTNSFILCSHLRLVIYVYLLSITYTCKLRCWLDVDDHTALWCMHIEDFIGIRTSNDFKFSANSTMLYMCKNILVSNTHVIQMIRTRKNGASAILFGAKLKFNTCNQTVGMQIAGIIF